MEAIDKELDEKMIEKSEIQTTIVDEVKPKVKKPRSEAQIKAFEKARAKRMENLKKKEEVSDATQEQEVVSPDPQLAVDDKSVSFADPKPLPVANEKPKRGRGRPKGVRNKKVMKHQEPAPTPDRPYYPQPVEHPIPQAQPPQYQFQGQAPNPYQQFQYYQPPPQQQAPVNNYYYYGQAPPQPPPDGEMFEPSSEEEEIVEEQPQELYEEPLRYRFV